MSQTGILKRVTKITAYTIALSLLVACSSSGHTQDQISLSTNTKYEIGFSPNGSSLDIILKGIQQSEKSILVAAYSFTSKPIATALLDAHNRGVSVQVIADKKSNSGKYSAVSPQNSFSAGGYWLLLTWRWSPPPPPLQNPTKSRKSQKALRALLLRVL